jgi:uncharacterized membrane protein
MRAPNPGTARRQGGSVVITSAIALSLLVIVLVGVELGYMFFLKRELQKTADLAALAGAQVLEAESCTTATAAAIANAARNLPPGMAAVAADSVACGHWDPSSRPSAPHFGPPESGQGFNAVRVTINRTPALLLAGLPGNAPRPIGVDAVAARKYPLAALNIRSTLVTVDSTQSPVLNAVFGGLLGGSLNLDAVGWNGLINTELNLLGFLDELALQLGIGAGKYDQVLAADVSVGTLLQAMINALQRSGNTAQVAVDALTLARIAANAAAAQPLLKLGDLLGVQSGIDAAGLDTGIQLFQLFQGVVQAANGKNGVAADVNLGGVTASIKVVEPPQFSAVGNPELAKIEPLGPNKIYVRTAQVRALVSANIGTAGQVLTTLVGGLLNALTSLSSALISILGSIIDLTPPGSCAIIAVNCHTPAKTEISDVKALPLPIQIDINIDLASASAYVTDYDCTNNSDRKLWANSASNIATLRIGKMGTSPADAKAKVFSSSSTPPVVEPIALIDVGTVQTRKTCTAVLLGACILSVQEYLQPNGTWTTQKATAKRTAFGGGGIGFSVDPGPFGGGSDSLLFHSSSPGLLKEINDAAAPAQTYLSTSATNNVTGLLTDTINGLQLNFYGPNASTGLLGSILHTTDAAVTAVFSLLKPFLVPLISSIVNSIVESLLKNLGIDLADAEVGARLSCKAGAELVY